MATATVHLFTTASTSVQVTIPDGLDPDDAREAAMEAAMASDLPTLCHRCETGSRSQPFIDMSAPWEVDDNDPHSVEVHS